MALGCLWGTLAPTPQRVMPSQAGSRAMPQPRFRIDKRMRKARQRVASEGMRRTPLSSRPRVDPAWGVPPRRDRKRVEGLCPFGFRRVDGRTRVDSLHIGRVRPGGHSRGTAARGVDKRRTSRGGTPQAGAVARREAGYADVKAFRTIFRKVTGLSPMEYRGKYNKEAA
jgi:AraC-like DNA-binding protein